MSRDENSSLLSTAYDLLYDIDEARGQVPPVSYEKEIVSLIIDLLEALDDRR